MRFIHSGEGRYGSRCRHDFVVGALHVVDGLALADLPATGALTHRRCPRNRFVAS